jgi:hypothetical protein
MINGADKVAKMLGYYAPETRRIDLSGDALVLHQRIRDMRDEDLVELASQRARVIDAEVCAA